MKRVAFGIDRFNWSIGLTITKHRIGTLLNFTILPFSMIIRIGGEKMK